MARAVDRWDRGDILIFPPRCVVLDVFMCCSPNHIHCSSVPCFSLCVMYDAARFCRSCCGFLLTVWFNLSYTNTNTNTGYFRHPVSARLGPGDSVRDPTHHEEQPQGMYGGRGRLGPDSCTLQYAHHCVRYFWLFFPSTAVGDVPTCTRWLLSLGVGKGLGL